MEGSGGLRTALRGLDAVDAVVHRVGPDRPGAHDRRMWSVGRLHPVSAATAYDGLAGRGLAVGGRPELEPTGWTSTCSARSRP